MVVAGTGVDQRERRGLSYFLMDMESPGVTVRPLVQITGSPEFNELFLEEVRIPQAQMLGKPGDGWMVALTTLMNERSGLGFLLQVRLRSLLDRLTEEAEQRGLLEGNPVACDRLAQLHAQVEMLRLTSYRGLSTIERYGQPGPEGSLAKLMWSETNQQLTQLACDLLGPDALRTDNEWSYELLRARANTIEGGTTEILKNIVAERVLQLPKAR